MEKSEPMELHGLKGMLNLELLPLFKHGTTAHYEGSIDKAGGNADWDWWLYPLSEGETGDNGEWVIFDCIGPGCIYNFVQHRYPTSEEPIFRFYFDGECEPRFTIRHSQFGELYPFVEPIASRYIGPPENGRGPIRVVRSFVPMMFAHSCRITSSLKLEGFDRARGHGGWGHVVYQKFADAENIKTFDITDPDYGYDGDFGSLLKTWKKVGTCPISCKEPLFSVVSPFAVSAGDSKEIFSTKGAGLITGIRLILAPGTYTPELLHSLSIRAVWDGSDAARGKADVDAPFGCVFSNEIGKNSIGFLMAGMNTDGCFYCFFPMPYLKSASIEIVNNGGYDVSFDYAAVAYTSEFNSIYESGDFGYFRTSDYYTRRHTEGADSMIANVTGKGHIVGSIITGFGRTPDNYASCEGDVRIHFNGIRTPQIESDGSESYACYGWGFPTPPESNPTSGYDGSSYRHTDWSMTRELTGDCYPYLDGFSFAIESGGNNDSYLEHSGIVFYYGVDELGMTELSEINYSDCDRAVELTSFFEGDDDHIPVTARGFYGRVQALEALLDGKYRYVIIRRMSDQKNGRQLASVTVDGEKITPWYFADRNPIKRWLEDDYVIPSKYIAGKSFVSIKIEPESDSFNSFGYRVFGVK